MSDYFELLEVELRAATRRSGAGAVARRWRGWSDRVVLVACLAMTAVVVFVALGLRGHAVSSGRGPAAPRHHAVAPVPRSSRHGRTGPSGAKAPAPSTVHSVLGPRGIGTVHFGASPQTVRATVDGLLHQRSGRFIRGGTCVVDHQITWWNQGTADGEPALVTYFSQGRFAGYQYNAIGRQRHPAGGWRLATARGLQVGDTLARGRRLYGKPFTISPAQGGTWHLRLPAGTIAGYASGTPRPGDPYGDVGWNYVVATIDAGHVGCPAVSP